MYVCMYVCMLNCIYVCMHVCIYVCICMYCILFYILHHITGSLVSVGVGPWYCMLEGPGSNPLCVQGSSFVQVLFSWGGGGGGNNTKVERKFPTTFWNM
jgi:hypothetical protein